MAMIGVAVLSLKFSSEINIGDLLTLCCAFGFAFHIFYTSKFVKDEDPVQLTIIQMMAAAVIGFVVVVFKGETTFSYGNGRFTSTPLSGSFFDNNRIFIANNCTKIHYRNKSCNHFIDRIILGYGIFSCDFKRSNDRENGHWCNSYPWRNRNIGNEI